MADNRIYKACIYARLSQEDGDKSESDSIVSQKALIREYISKQQDIRIVSEKADDGYSGVNFERPAFQEMMEEIRAGKVDCVVVKDLSRFGRNYIESGNYIEKVFPFLGIRFIAINDDYDSVERRHSDSLIVPFKNLINDAYCKDISVKIRSQLEIKRKKGQYIGPNAVYGYRKDEEDHNHLVPDTYAAEVVRTMFRWKQQGMSVSRIAEKLNVEGVLCPMEYKQSNGIGVQTIFRSGQKAKWSASSVRRILTNEVYTGVLVQGKSSTPNYKVKKNFPKDKKEWIRVEDAHEPIIEKRVFSAIQELLKRDVRSAPGKKFVYPLSGYLFCADCGQNLTRMSTHSGGKRFDYYVCSSYRNGKRCSSHRIPVPLLNEAVLETIQLRIEAVARMRVLLKQVEKDPVIWSDQMNLERYDRLIAERRQEIEHCMRFKQKLYENLVDGTLDRKDYSTFQKNYEIRIEEAEDVIRKAEKEREMVAAQEVGDQSWMEDFKKYKKIRELERSAVVALIDRIEIAEKRKIEVRFRDEEAYEMVESFLNRVKKEEIHGAEEQEKTG